MHDKISALRVATDLTKLALLLELVNSESLELQAQSEQLETASIEVDAVVKSLDAAATFLSYLSLIDTSPPDDRSTMYNLGSNVIPAAGDFFEAQGGYKVVSRRAASLLAESQARLARTNDSTDVRRIASNDPGLKCGIYCGVAVAAAFASAGMLAAVAGLAAIDACL